MPARRLVRWMGAAIALVVGVAALVAFLLSRSLPAPREPRSAAAAKLQERILGLAPAASLPSLSVVPATGHGPDEYEICGVGWFKVEGEKPTAADVARIAGQIDLPAGRRQTVEALRADRNDRAQAMAVLLAGLGDDYQFSAELVGRIADIASRSSDPALYGFALRTCGKVTAAESSCGLLSAAQWARLDPGNAAPWFEVLDSASGTRDAAGRNEVLHRIATSERNVRYEGVMPSVIHDHAPAGDRGALLAWLLGVEAIGIEAAWVRDYRVITSSCSGPALIDANRRQTCTAIAELLVERSSDGLDRAIGGSMGERLDWPADRTDRLRGESLAYAQARTRSLAVESDLGCATVRGQLELFRQKADIGEVEQQRRWVVASGRAPEDFVAIGRRQREVIAASSARSERERAAAAAASTPASGTR